MPKETFKDLEIPALDTGRIVRRHRHRAPERMDLIHVLHNIDMKRQPQITSVRARYDVQTTLRTHLAIVHASRGLHDLDCETASDPRGVQVFGR